MSTLVTDDETVKEIAESIEQQAVQMRYLANLAGLHMLAHLLGMVALEAAHQKK